jgi:dTMP kinase
MFITFEGPDGGGKSTQMALLADYLTEQGYSLFRTREPGGTSISEQIRTVLHDNKNQEMDPHAEILLYSASRAQLVAEKIRPALERGEIILCDRFFDSTYAYQGYGHGLNLDMLRSITEFATGGLKPDLTIYLDVDPDEGLRRRQKDQDGEWNRLDDMALSFHQRVHDGYLKLIDAQPERWIRIDATQPIEDVHGMIKAAVMERLAKMAQASS